MLTFLRLWHAESCRPLIDLKLDEDNKTWSLTKGSGVQGSLFAVVRGRRSDPPVQVGPRDSARRLVCWPQIRAQHQTLTAYLPSAEPDEAKVVVVGGSALHPIKRQRLTQSRQRPANSDSTGEKRTCSIHSFPSFSSTPASTS